jgi:hypothetical protein
MRRAGPALFLICVGCATTRREHAASKVEPKAPVRHLTFVSGGMPLPADPSWQRGQAGDEMDFARLGRQEGATALLQKGQQGGPTGAVALRALALAPDARAERGHACQLLSDVRLEERPFVLDVVHHILSDSPPLYEALAPGADAECVGELRAIAEDGDALARERDLAESSLANISGAMAVP